MADEKKPVSDREKLMRVLVPAAAVGFIVILVAIVVATSDPSRPTTEKDKVGRGGSETPPPTGGTDVSKLTDGTAPAADDPQLKDIGDGLKIRDLKVGDGPVVQRGQEVTAYYTGWLTNGTVFDSSRQRGEPIKFKLTGVVKGWQQGIPGMKVGGIRKLVIPPELGYGADGAPPKIPPNATLVFEVEIVK
jgi:hypothetical protein